MATREKRITGEAVEALIEERSQATARRFGVAVKSPSSKARTCDGAKRNYENARKDWEANGKPTSGPLWEALTAADVAVFIFCELP